MSKASKETFQFTFQHFVRLALFLLILILLISSISSSSTFSGSSNDPTILGEEASATKATYDLTPYLNDLNKNIPPSIKDSFGKISSSPAIISLQQQSSGLIKNLDGFPGKQIKELKLSIIKTIYDALLKEVENQ